MRLKNYMENHDLTARYIAQKAGVSLSAVRKWVQGTRVPRLPQIKRIEKITQGQVSLHDWE